MSRPVLPHSPLLTGPGIPHAFSNREGGVSAGMFKSLHLGDPGELEGTRHDQPATIATTTDRAIIELRLCGQKVVRGHQMRSGWAIAARIGAAAHDESTPKADAVVTNAPARARDVHIAG